MDAELRWRAAGVSMKALCDMQIACDAYRDLLKSHKSAFSPLFSVQGFSPMFFFLILILIS